MAPLYRLGIIIKRLWYREAFKVTFDTIRTPADPVLLGSREQNIDPLAGRNGLDQALEALVAVYVVFVDHVDRSLVTEWSEIERWIR